MQCPSGQKFRKILAQFLKYFDQLDVLLWILVHCYKLDITVVTKQ